MTLKSQRHVWIVRAIQEVAKSRRVAAVYTPNPWGKVNIDVI